MPRSASHAFTGLTGRVLASSYVELAVSRYDMALRQPRHGHDPAYFTAVLDGAYDERVGSRGLDVTAGALVYHPQGEEHAVQFRAHTLLFRVLPRNEMLEAARLAGLDMDAIPRDLPAVAPVVARMRREFAAADCVTPLSLDALSCELIAQLVRASGRAESDHAGARLARDMLEASLAHPPALSDLARTANCHPITLARAFRREFGCSVGGYVRRRRLQEACTLLRESGEPIAMVAAQAGFADQAHLTRSLRRAIGVTPAGLRRRPSPLA